MRVSTGEERLGRAGECLLELVVGRGRKQGLDIGARRAVEAEEGDALGGDRQRRRQRAEVVEVGATECRQGPGDDLAEPVRLVAAAGRQLVEQPPVGVAAYAAAAELAQAGDHRLRLRSAGSDIAEADDL